MQNQIIISFLPAVFILISVANFYILDRLWVMALDLVKILHFTFICSLNLIIIHRIIPKLA